MKDDIRDLEVEDFDPELDRRLDIALAEKNKEYADIREETYRFALARTELDLPENPRVAFYVRPKRKFDPVMAEMQAEIAKIWLPRIGELQEIITDDGDMTQFSGCDFDSYDLIVTPDIHQFGDTLAEALKKVCTIPCPVFIESECMFSKEDPHYYWLRLLMYEETDLTEDWDEEENPRYVFYDEIMEKITAGSSPHDSVIFFPEEGESK